MYLFPIALTILTINDPITAYQKPSTEKPSINEAANQNKEAFITTINKPNVTIVIGRVSNINIGLTNRFSKPITIAATSAG